MIHSHLILILITVAEYDEYGEYFKLKEKSARNFFLFPC